MLLFIFLWRCVGGPFWHLGYPAFSPRLSFFCRASSVSAICIHQRLLFSFRISGGGLPCVLLLPVCFALLFLLQLFTVGQRFAAASAVMLPTGCAVAMSGAAYTPAGAGILRHMFHYRFSSMAAPAQARPMPRSVTAVCGSRLPRQDSTTTAMPMAKVTALKITEMISRIGFFPYLFLLTSLFIRLFCNK